MILNIDKNDRDIYERACAELDMECAFYTNENKEALIRIEVQWRMCDKSLSDIDHIAAFQLGRMVQMYWQEQMEKTYKESSRRETR